MAFVIAESCIGTKDTACVDACPVDCIHPKKNTKYDDARPGFDEVPQLYIDPVERIDCGASWRSATEAVCCGRDCCRRRQAVTFISAFYRD